MQIELKLSCYMRVFLDNLLAIIVAFGILVLLCIRSNAYADNKFQSSHPCSNGSKICVSSGVRTVDGYQVHRDCWEWGYSKTCSYPSKNNCSNLAHCYEIGIVRCLLSDSIGNCVNQYKEFSCKRWVFDQKESQKIRTDLVEKDGPEGLVCKGVPCIDGNCVDKSYLTNGEMMDSVSKLYAVSEAKGAKDLNFKIFEGFPQHCSKKVAQYTNCCAGSIKGWGKELGAKCTKDEKQLNDYRSKNLCVYVGKQNKGYMKTVVKHHYCCFGNMLNKVIQVQGRKQLGLSFGSGGSPDCRGLTLAEILKINWEQIDFGEFIEDLKLKFFGKYKAPNASDISARIKSSLPNIKKYDNNPNNKANNASGWNNGVKDDSFEAEEENKFASERIQKQAEQDRQKEMAAKAEIQRQKSLKEQEQRIIRKRQKEADLANARSKYTEANTAMQDFRVRRGITGHVNTQALWYPAYANLRNNLQNEEAKVRQLEQDLARGNY